jgi:hypothetical protein
VRPNGTLPHRRSQHRQSICGFRASVEQDGLLAGRRRPALGKRERFAGFLFALQVIEDLLDHRGVFNAGDDFHRAAANPAAGIRPGQGDWCNLPGDTPLVLAPTALALLASIADDRVPITIGLGLIFGGNLERKRLIVLDGGSTVKPQAGDAHHGELDRQHVTLLTRRKVSGCAMHRTDGRIGEGPGIEPRRLFGVAIVSKANRVLCDLRHVAPPSQLATDRSSWSKAREQETQ